MDRSKAKYKQQLEASTLWKKNNPERHAELARAYRRRNPLKSKAQNQLNYAIRKGLIARQPCEGCGTKARVHAHHDDYRKPLDVRWLCFKCHKKAHPVSDVDKQVKFAGAERAKLSGSENPNAKLSERDVQQIRLMLSMGVSQERIGKAYGVSQVTVSRIKRGVYWQNVFK